MTRSEAQLTILGAFFLFALSLAALGVTQGRHPSHGGATIDTRALELAITKSACRL